MPSFRPARKRASARARGRRIFTFIEQVREVALLVEPEVVDRDQQVRVQARVQQLLDDIAAFEVADREHAMAEPGERGADLTLQVVVALEQDYRQQFIAHPGADEPGVRVQSAARAVLIGRRLFLSVGRAFRLLTEPGSGHVLDVEPEQREQQVQRFRVEEVVEHTLLRGVDLRREP